MENIRAMDSGTALPLWHEATPHLQHSDDVPTLTAYLVPGGSPRGAVIVCPGGGYVMRADHEGDPVALWLNSLGIHAFVLAYRVAPNRHPVPFMDAQRAVQTVRHHAREWGIDPGKIGMLGFSAGGHLAATAGIYFDLGDNQSADPIERQSSRPDALILCYAVISFGEFGHEGVVENLLGEKSEATLRASLSLETQVTPGMPPAFLWHTGDDDVVPVENSLLLASALGRHKIPFELHVYPSGRHGLGLADGDPVVSQWTNACARWLQGLGY